MHAPNRSADRERPATYREIFAVGEFSAVFVAFLLSVAGDQFAKVAVAVLVYARTDSQLLSAIAFGIGYVPWVIGGPVLASLGDRFRPRTVMIACDVTSTLLVAAIAIPGLPLWLLIGLLLASSALAPAFLAARSASLPEILDGDRYVLGLSVTKVAHQFAQVTGFLGGGLLIKLASPPGAILVDAATFAASGLIIARFMKPRERPHQAGRSSLLRDSVDGLRLTLGSRPLASYMFLAWIGAAFLAAPEGLMPSYARYLGGDERLVGALYAGIPLGATVGLICYGRLVRPTRRYGWIRSLALLSLLSLVPIALDPGPWPLFALLVVAGFGSAFQLGVNAAFVRTVPPPFRARAFGVAAAGLQAVQGAAIALAGALADHCAPPIVVGVCGLIGALAALPVLLRWPADQDSVDSA